MLEISDLRSGGINFFCFLVFTYAKSRFSDDAAHISKKAFINQSKTKMLPTKMYTLRPDQKRLHFTFFFAINDFYVSVDKKSKKLNDQFSEEKKRF